MTNMKPPTVQPRSWAPRGHEPEPAVMIRCAKRYLVVSAEHLRFLADLLHDVADDHEIAERKPPA
ncbi:hypothetical protein GCM10011490_06790 [Pseudoclavibacter endophyticus]|uniref:Uncharacterized protein n=2 Tax=Pseudoclavibacter endophyticus TaxID=1778590 RepID=A0A6H9WTS9_9MICO|nr:hypothetical protein [Pseudoclavibacter endophyticus]KAB1649834.1 hypothetical protein F8O04_06290 [Pseudoclavibacter endophyticus]GGA59416.1 hypothetical protein GCM10011490_06790 [Pseudoclavibacter endophyticus]